MNENCLETYEDFENELVKLILLIVNSEKEVTFIIKFKKFSFLKNHNK